MLCFSRALCLLQLTPPPETPAHQAPWPGLLSTACCSAWVCCTWRCKSPLLPSPVVTALRRLLVHWVSAIPSLSPTDFFLPVYYLSFTSYASLIIRSSVQDIMISMLNMLVFILCSEMSSPFFFSDYRLLIVILVLCHVKHCLSHLLHFVCV